MALDLKIDKAFSTPVYQQVVHSILTRIQDGSFSMGSQLPSINKVACDYNLARETVVKAFKILQKQGIISPVPGKGYFVSSLQLNVKNRIFVLFDTFSAYKEVIYHALNDSAGPDDFIDIYFHHFNFKVFEKMIHESLGHYQSYIIIPMEHEKLELVLDSIPADKLFLLDLEPKKSGRQYCGVFQNFEDDIFNALGSAVDLCRKYSQLILVFRNQVTDPPAGIVKGFTRFCKANKFESVVIRTSLSRRKLTKGEAYIVIDDEDLVYLAENAKAQGLELGSDVGILSYNETPLKKIAANGISVLSTDFARMGNLAGQMVIHKKRTCQYNSFGLINRGSF